MKFYSILTSMKSVNWCSLPKIGLKYCHGICFSLQILVIFRTEKFMPAHDIKSEVSFAVKVSKYVHFDIVMTFCSFGEILAKVLPW